MAIFGRDHLAALYDAAASIFEVAVEAELDLQRENNAYLEAGEKKPLDIDYMTMLSGILVRLTTADLPSGGALDELAKAFTAELAGGDDDDDQAGELPEV